MKLQTKQSALKLAQLANELADRFERIGLDEAGKMDTPDRTLLYRVRKLAEKVLSGK